ncbi:hypothetical protein GOODEAATRI_023214, partial [Goodea atripinnis]
EQFKKAEQYMLQKKHQIDEMFQLDVKYEAESPKVKEYKQVTIQNLQLCIYSKKYNAGPQHPSSAHEGKIVEALGSLVSECYWLGCLMALNNPPFHPDWENHPPSEQKWDIFPQTMQYSETSYV